MHCIEGFFGSIFGKEVSGPVFYCLLRISTAVARAKLCLGIIKIVETNLLYIVNGK